MFTTTANIQIRTLNSSGTPTSAVSLEGVVRNFEGERVDTITFDDLTETAAGVYTAVYDVADSDKFPGTEFTVFWCVADQDVSPEIAYQSYPLFSPLPTSGSTRLLTWCPRVAPGVYGYEIFRSLPDQSALPYGKSVFPYFFDRGEYATPRDRALAQFSIQTLLWGPDETPTASGEVLEGELIVNDKDYCEVFGEIIDVRGAGRLDSVYFYVHEKDVPQESGRSYLMRRNEVSVTPNVRGQFSVPLVQGSLVTAEIPGAGVIRRFIVPDRPKVNLKDLEFYPLDTHRAQ